MSGEFDGNEFSLVSSGRYFRIALIQQGELTALWQNSPEVTMWSKKYRIRPYVLMDIDQSEEVCKNKMTLLGLGQVINKTLLTY